MACGPYTAAITKPAPRQITIDTRIAPRHVKNWRPRFLRHAMQDSRGNTNNKKRAEYLLTSASPSPIAAGNKVFQPGSSRKLAQSVAAKKMVSDAARSVVT